MFYKIHMNGKIMYAFLYMPAERILQLYAEVITGVHGSHYGCRRISVHTYYCMRECMWFVYVHMYIHNSSLLHDRRHIECKNVYSVLNNTTS